MKKWDVVLLSFPFSHQLDNKVRPAVVISPDNYHQRGSDVLVMLVTSNTTRNSQYEVLVTTAHPEFHLSGLRKDSVIRVSKMVTLEKSAVQHLLGKLGKTLIAEVERELRNFFQLPPYQQQLPAPNNPAQNPTGQQ